MQGGARKAAMAGFFFFTKKRLDGAASAPRRPPRSSGRPDDFADHSSGYPRPSRAAGRFYARQRPLRRHPPLPRAADRKSERRRHGSRGRTPAVSDRRRGQRFFAKEARGIVKRDGKGAAAQGETGAAAGRTEWESGRAPGMEERMMAGPGGGNGENGRESGRVRTGQDEEESGRAWRGACRGRGNGAMTRGKRACAGVDRGKGVRAAAGGGWTRADGGQTGKRGGPPGTKSAPLLCKTTRRACAKKAHSCFTKTARRAQKARPCFAKRPGGRAQK